MAKRYGGRWEIIESYNEGGQAHIFRVKDLASGGDRAYILKRLKNTVRADRFKQEIETLRRLENENILSVVDYGLEGDSLFFVSEHVADSTLEEMRIESVDEALTLFIAICKAVRYAHAKGVVHRDLKPENILITDDNKPIIIDFGLCYIEDDSSRLTGTMEQVGSRFYMAPEMEAGLGDVTNAVDIYSLGKVLYFLLTGKHIPRENYSGVNDLVELTGNKQLRYVTDRILSRTIVEEPSERFKIDHLISQAENVHQLLREHYYPGFVGSKCRYCGSGNYVLLPGDADISARVKKPGRQIVEHYELSMLVCETCGNVLLFKGTVG